MKKRRRQKNSRKSVPGGTAIKDLALCESMERQRRGVSRDVRGGGETNLLWVKRGMQQKNKPTIPCKRMKKANIGQREGTRKF